MRNWGTEHMLNLPVILKRVEKIVADNSPLIMTVVGVTGTLATAYLTGKATFKAAEILAEEEAVLDRVHSNEDFERIYTFKYKFDHVWKLYIPAAGTAVLTVAAIIFSHHVSTRRAAALASAYAISEKAFEEYKEKVVSKMGEKKEEQVRDELAQDRLNRDPVSRREVIIVNGNVLCYDVLTGRYFLSDMETIRKAQNDINEQIIHSHYASLGDFFDKIGLPQTGLSEELGWNLETMLDIHYSTQMSDDNRPCVVITYEVSPARNYFRMG